MTVNRVMFFAAALCFAIALLGAVSAISGVDQQEWVDGGALAIALGLAL